MGAHAVLPALWMDHRTNITDLVRGHETEGREMFFWNDTGEDSYYLVGVVMTIILCQNRGTRIASGRVTLVQENILVKPGEAIPTITL